MEGGGVGRTGKGKKAQCHTDQLWGEGGGGVAQGHTEVPKMSVTHYVDGPLMKLIDCAQRFPIIAFSPLFSFQ